MALRPSNSIPIAGTAGSGRFAALAVVVLLAAATLSAQSVPTGVQEYYVLGWEQHIWDMMDRVQNAQGGAQFANGMNWILDYASDKSNPDGTGGRDRPVANALLVYYDDGNAAEK